MIVDSHMHSFPYVGGPSGFPSSAEHLRFTQRQQYSTVNPVRRAQDGEIVTSQTLWNGQDVGPGGLLDVNFRAGRYGRFEWQVKGESVYVQLFAPGLKDNACEPEYVIAEMDYANVDVAVLQQGPTYGRLNDHLAECQNRYPERFRALIEVRELLAHTDEQLSELRRCVEKFRMTGLFYSHLGFWEDGYRSSPEDAKYEPFWAEVERYGLVVYWDCEVDQFPDPAAYERQLHSLAAVLDRHPTLQVVIVQALPAERFFLDGRVSLPEIARELGRRGTVLFEIAYPISYGNRYEYPYLELSPYLSYLYDAFGPRNLVWGSDMPNVSRFCTYQQSVQYLNHYSFLSVEDLKLIRGGNLARLFNIGEKL